MTLTIRDQELILQDLWKSRGVLGQELATLSGKEVEVLYAGSYNLDTGPDFKDAVVKIGGALRKGDIEVHLYDAGWYEHNHHSDPVYNNVILHIISCCKKDAIYIEREDGVRVEQVLVSISEQKRTGQPGETMKSVSGQQFLVADCPLSRETPADIIRVVNSAGHERLRTKVEQLREDLQENSWDQLLYKKILEALGYSKNQMSFRKLAALVPFDMLVAEMQWVEEAAAEIRCSALLFGASGLLPVTRESRAGLAEESLEYVIPLVETWGQMRRRIEIKPMQAREWQFFRLRPQNFPTRRLAGMIKLLMKGYRHGLLEMLLAIIQGTHKNLRLLTRELIRHISQKTDGFWASHFRFEDPQEPPSAGTESHLIGKERAHDIVVNIFIPVLYLYAEESNSGRLQNITTELFRRSPKLAENEITRTMRMQLMQEGKGGVKMKSALQQQGLLHLGKFYCRFLRCQDCLNLGKEDIR